MIVIYMFLLFNFITAARSIECSRARNIRHRMGPRGRDSRLSEFGAIPLVEGILLLASDLAESWCQRWQQLKSADRF